MTAQVGQETTQQTSSGAVKRDWEFNDELKGLAQPIANGRNLFNALERWGVEFVETVWVRLYTDYELTTRQRVRNIIDNKGNIRWPGEYEIKSINPTFDPFGEFVEYSVLLAKAEVQ